MANLEKSKKEFIERLNEAFTREKQRRIKNKEPKLTKNSLAEIIGVTPQSVTKWFKKGTIDSKKIPALAKELNSNLAWLEHGIGNPKILSDNSVNGDNFEPTNHKTGNGKVPEISYVQAGEFSEAIDTYEPGYAEQWHPRIKEGEHIYVLRVKGDSMTSQHGKSFPEGMLLHVDPDNRCPNNGDYVIAKINGEGDVTFKQFKLGETRPYLQPLNTRGHDPIYDEFSILGVVVFAGWEL